MVREGQETDSGLTTGLGLGLGALQALPVAKPLARGAKAAGKALGPKAAEMAEGYLLKSGLAPQLTAYHGTPHKFAPEEGAPLGKFKTEKIGTGEGAQAYGHGIYFAESPGVAEDYRNVLGSPRNMVAKGRGVYIEPSPMGDGKYMLATRSETGKMVGTAGDATQFIYPDKTFNSLADAMRFAKKKGLIAKEARPQLVAINEDGKYVPIKKAADVEDPQYSQFIAADKGSLYTVDIPDEMIPRMLDWDKPLSQQSKEVQEALQNSGLLVDVSKVGEVAAEKIRRLAEQPRVADWAKRDLLQTAAQLEKSPSPKHVAGVLKGMQLEYGINADSGPFSDVANDFLSFVKGMQAVPNMDTGGGAVSYLEALYGPSGASQRLKEAGIPGVRYLDQGSRDTGKGTSNFVVFPGEEEKVKILERKAEGGLVTDTDAIAAKLKSTGMDDQKAFMQALRMADARQEAHMAKGGLLKALKGSKASTKSHPTVFPPAAPLTEAEMRPIAQRVAGQMTGEFVRPNPKLSVNPAGKAKKTFEREKTLPVEVTQRIEQKPAPYINYEEMKDAYLAGVPGDPTRGGVAKPGSLSEIHEGAEELRRLGDVEFEKTESGPVQLFGGSRYGAYSERDFWGSNLGPARAIQNTVDELGALGPVYGQYIKMSPESTNFALHNLDALLAYLQPEKLSKSKLEILNREIRKGSPKYGKFPGFSGFEDPIDVLLQSQLHSDLRKHIAETLMKPKLTSSLGLRQGSDVLFGISEPSLRNLETGVSGYSVGKMEPGKALTPSLHPTYDYDIPGSFLGQSKYPTPYEIAFPTSTAYTRANLKPGAQEFNTLKMIGAREKIDQQYIDQIKMYEELMKEYTGKKKGGLVKKTGLSVLNEAII
jgi:hypothetical protein